MEFLRGIKGPLIASLVGQLKSYLNYFGTLISNGLESLYYELRVPTSRN